MSALERDITGKPWCAAAASISRVFELPTCTESVVWHVALHGKVISERSGRKVFRYFVASQNEIKVQQRCFTQ